MLIIEDGRIKSDCGKEFHKIGEQSYFNDRAFLKGETLEMFEEIDERPKYTKEEYERKVAELIRERYSQDEENAIKSKVLASLLPNTLSEETNEKHMKQFEEFNAYREQCKAEAKAILSEPKPSEEDTEHPYTPTT